MNRSRRSVVSVAGACVAIVGVAELLHRRAARSAVEPGRGDRAAVVVLGYPTQRGGLASATQRWRVAVGVRMMRRTAAERMLFCGGAVANRFPEARTMAALAREFGVDERTIVTETTSRSTRENVRFAHPLVVGIPTIVIASDPLHAMRARRYWLEEHPDEADRVFVADAFGPFEAWWLKVPTAIYEVAIWVRDEVRPGCA